MPGQKTCFQKSLKRLSNTVFLVNSQDRLSYYLGKAETLFKILNIFEVENLPFSRVFIKFNTKHILSRQVSHSKDSFICTYIGKPFGNMVYWLIL